MPVRSAAAIAGLVWRLPLSAPRGRSAAWGKFVLGLSCGKRRGETPVPRLAGMPAARITEAMLAFRARQRLGTIMPRIAKGFSDDEIAAIAAWYAAQPAE